MDERQTAQAARLARVIAGAQTGQTLAQLGASEGVTGAAVRLWLLEAGLRIGELRGITCAQCGVLLTCAKAATPAGRHCCGRAACQCQARREARAQDARPWDHCAHCGATLHYQPRPEGPRFCMLKACRAAKQRYRYATNPQHRAYYRSYQRVHLAETLARQRARYATDLAYREQRRAHNRARRRAQPEGACQEVPA